MNQLGKLINRIPGSASHAISASVLKALSGKLDIKGHSPSILYLYVCLQKQVFEPPNVRMEDREDKQKQMEQEFEDMYMAGTGTILSLFVLIVYPILID